MVLVDDLKRISRIVARNETSGLRRTTTLLLLLGTAHTLAQYVVGAMGYEYRYQHPVLNLLLPVGALFLGLYLVWSWMSRRSTMLMLLDLSPAIADIIVKSVSLMPQECATREWMDIIAENAVDIEAHLNRLVAEASHTHSQV